MYNVFIAVSVDGCNIEVNSPEAAGTPTYKGNPPSNGYKTYSCSNGHNCSYSVHVIGVYEANNLHGYNYHPTGTSDVYVRVTGSGDTRPLVLVLSNYEPIRWRLHITSNMGNVVISKVIIVSCYCTYSVVLLQVILQT